MNRAYLKSLYIWCNLALIMAAFISGLSFIAQKIGMLYTGPFTFNALRCLIGSLCLAPVVFLFKFIGSYKLDNLLKGGISAGVVLFIAFSINQYCMIYADAGKAGFITSLYIIFVPFIAVFLKHELRQNVIISVIIAFVGLYLLCAKDFTSFNLWDIGLLVSAFFFALHIIIVSYYSKKADAIKLSALQFLVAGMLSLPSALLFESPSITSILAGWKPILFIGVIVTAGAYTLQIFGHKATKPVLATLILSSEAVFAVLGGILILGETLSLKEVLGCIIMVLAIVISQFKHKKEVRYDSNC